MYEEIYVNRAMRCTINGKTLYDRIPIALKVLGTRANDTQILLDCGIPVGLCDLAYNTTTSVYSPDTDLLKQKGYFPSFSTTKLLQLLPPVFNKGGIQLGIFLNPEKVDGFGRTEINGTIVNLDTAVPVETFTGHPFVS